MMDEKDRKSSKRMMPWRNQKMTQATYFNVIWYLRGEGGAPKKEKKADKFEVQDVLCVALEDYFD